MFKQEKAVRIPVGDKIPTLKVNVASHPLDTYQSPHLLDLSQSRYIEKVKPVSNTVDLDYGKLPGGDLLSKLYVFDLLDLEKSEVYNALKSVTHSLEQTVKRPFQQVDFSPKLPLTLGNDRFIKRTLIWQDVLLVNLAVFFFSGAVNAWNLLRSFFLALEHSFRQKPDEVVSFKLREIEDDPVEEIIQEEAFEDIFKEEDVPEIPIQKAPFIWPSFNFSFSRTLKPVLVFAVLALLAVMPFRAYTYYQTVRQAKGLVLGEAENAIANLSLAQGKMQELDLKNAQEYFVSADLAFTSAQQELKTINSPITFLAEIMPFNNSYKTGKNLIDLGKNLSAAGNQVLDGVNRLSENPSEDLTEKIKFFQTKAALALPELKKAENNLNKIKIGSLPEENRDQFIKLKEKLPLLISGLEKLGPTSEFAIKFLGDNDLRRYLVIFQNDNELRATGGFMGSFALVDLKSGQLEKITLPGGGTYDVRAGLNELLKAPQPFWLINTRWEFQDSNWWPDWPTSAEKISWFYRKSGGPSIDGVIAINSDWLGQLLDVTGEIQLPDYGKTITSANFELELQKSIEREATDKYQPKKILADLAPKLVERIFASQPKDFLNLAVALEKGLKEKDILVYLTDPELEKVIQENGWDGSQKQGDKDYLMVVSTNISGGKTDGVIKQEIYHQAEIQNDGSVLNSVIISRHHFGPTDEDFTNQPNRSYMRVYVPQGSVLVKAAGFNQPDEKEFKKDQAYLDLSDDLKTEFAAQTDLDSQTRIYEENGKTVFANWLTLDQGGSQDLLLVYRLPFKMNLKDFSLSSGNRSYNLLVQRQPGMTEGEFSSKVAYPEGLSPKSAYPENLLSNGLNFQANLNQDLFYNINF